MTEALCQVCGDAIHEDRVYCSRCHSLHHRDCWDFNEGCAIYACGGRECWHVDPSGDAPAEVVYIREPRGSPAANPATRSAHRGSAGNWFVFLSMLAVCVMRGLEPDPPRPPSHVRKPSSHQQRRDNLRRLQARMAQRPLTVVNPADASLQPKGSDLLSVPAPIGFAQTTRDRPDLPRGELVFLLKEARVDVRLPGLNVRGKQFQGVTESGRFVNLGPSDFELVPNPAQIRDVRHAQSALRSLRTSGLPGTFPRWVILVDPASESGALAPGTLVQVDGVEMGTDGPASYHGRCKSGEVTVPAVSCRPLLALALQRETKQ